MFYYIIKYLKILKILIVDLYFVLIFASYVIFFNTKRNWDIEGQTI